jgi:hypothetical protein
MLLVEGVSDRRLILRAFAESGMLNPYDVVALPELDERLQGGDEVALWLRHNGPALRARPDTSPIFVLRDWESSQTAINRVSVALAVHPTSRCVAWPKDLTSPDLSDSFVGIEKLLSTQFIEHLGARGILTLRVPADTSRVSWRYDVERREFEGAKARMHAELEERRAADDLLPLVGALGWLTAHLRAAPPML